MPGGAPPARQTPAIFRAAARGNRSLLAPVGRWRLAPGDAPGRQREIATAAPRNDRQGSSPAGSLRRGWNAAHAARGMTLGAARRPDTTAARTTASLAGTRPARHWWLAGSWRAPPSGSGGHGKPCPPCRSRRARRVGRMSAVASFRRACLMRVPSGLPWQQNWGRRVVQAPRVPDEGVSSPRPPGPGR